jgi:hypothetical protein
MNAAWTTASARSSAIMLIPMRPSACSPGSISHDRRAVVAQGPHLTLEPTVGAVAHERVGRLAHATRSRHRCDDDDEVELLRTSAFVGERTPPSKYSTPPMSSGAK